MMMLSKVLFLYLGASSTCTSQNLMSKEIKETHTLSDPAYSISMYKVESRYTYYLMLGHR